MYIAGQLLISLLCAFTAKDWSDQILLNLVCGLILIIWLGTILDFYTVLRSSPQALRLENWTSSTLHLEISRYDLQS